jgi:hypothetical protein
MAAVKFLTFDSTDIFAMLYSSTACIAQSVCFIVIVPGGESR